MEGGPASLRRAPPAIPRPAAHLRVTLTGRGSTTAHRSADRGTQHHRRNHYDLRSRVAQRQAGRHETPGGAARMTRFPLLPTVAVTHPRNTQTNDSTGL